MTRLVRQPYVYLLLGMIFIVVLAGCGDGEDETPAPPAATVAVVTPDAVDAGTIEPAAQAGGTRVVFVTAVPTITPSITPTFDFVIDDYSGIWAFELAIRVPAGKPIPEIEEWSYSTQLALTVDQYGIITGDGTLQPTHYSPACIIEVVAADPATNVNAYAPFMVSVIGSVRDDPDNNIFFDITLVPINAAIAESYDLDCVFEETPRNATFQYIWPVLRDGEQLSFRVPLQGSRFAPETRFEIDAASVTDGLYEGTVQGTITLFRQQ